jgi:hypothetical protein
VPTGTGRSHNLRSKVKKKDISRCSNNLGGSIPQAAWPRWYSRAWLCFSLPWALSAAPVRHRLPANMDVQGSSPHAGAVHHTGLEIVARQNPATASTNSLPDQ